MFRLIPLIIFTVNFFILSESLILQRPTSSSAFLLEDIGENIEDQLAQYDDDVLLRLPNDTRPLSYDIELTSRIDQENFTFDGFVRIRILIVNQTNQIVLHKLDLNIETIALWTTDMIPSPLLITYTYDNYTEFLIINVSDRLLIPGENYNLEIRYNGELSTGTRGFYRSYYVNGNNETVYLATTQFQPSSARQAFPCYDEPAMKAQFTITINHGRNYTALSNMRENTIFNEDSETARTTFEQTPIMSTYLVAFVISDFHFINNTSNGIIHRSYSRSTAIAEAQLSLDAGIPILEAIEEYLTIPYILPKIDQITIPHFAAGAMENWGLVTYSERYFLFNENETYYDDLTEIILTISHEYIHQWFGNLVTTKWWSQTWLNEGFANYFEYYITNLVFPEWKMMEYFVYNNLQNVLISDANANTLPMTYYVERREDVSARFNYVSYAKSGSVIRMFVNAFSDKTFTKGLIYYLNDMKFNNALEEDLFRNLQIAVTEDQMLSDQLNVQDIFSSWSQQSGYPLLTVTRNYNESTVQVQYERYLTEPNDTLSSVSKWYIPYNYVTSLYIDFSNTLPMHWLHRNTVLHLLLMNELTSNDWIIFNKQATGYYRVQYDIHNWQLIANQLRSKDYEKIHPYSRSQLIDDSFTFARTKRLPWEIPLNIITYLRYESEYAPWASANRHIQFLSVYMRAVVRHDLYQRFINDQIELLFDNIGINDIENEPHLNKYLRSIAIDLACTYELEKCVRSAYETVNTIIDNGQQVHQNLRNVLYCASMRNDTFYLFDKLRNRLNVTTDTIYRRQLIMGLGCTRRISLQYELLELSISFIIELTTTERNTMFAAVYTNSEDGVISSLSFLVEFMDEAHEMYTQVQFENHINALSKVITVELQMNWFSQVLTIYGAKSYANETVINLAYSYLNETQIWLNTNLLAISDWIESYELVTSTTTTVTTTDTTTTTTEDPGVAITINISKFTLFITLLIVITMV